jgi:PAS domain-containing protein
MVTNLTQRNSGAVPGLWSVEPAERCQVFVLCRHTTSNIYPRKQSYACSQIPEKILDSDRVGLAMNVPPGLPLHPRKGSDDHLQPLLGVGILSLLECDPRPSFILDTTSAVVSHGSLISPVYWNPAMNAADAKDILSAFTGIASANDLNPKEKNVALFLQFRSWVLEESAKSKSFIWCSFVWTKIVVAGRWNVVSGVATSAFTPNNDAKSTEMISPKEVSQIKSTTFDWTADNPPEGLSPFIIWARSIDWASTSLGPLSTWTPQLRTVTNLMMRDPRPSLLFWGPDMTVVYNEAYVEHSGKNHPCMGAEARTAFASVWSERFEPMFEKNMAGETVQVNSMGITLVRNGFAEETYFTLTCIPILDAEGSTVGFYEPFVETVCLFVLPCTSLTCTQTREVVSQRYLQILLSLSGELPRTRDSDSYWALATEILSRNDKDIPFALLYSTDIVDDVAVPHTDPGRKCTLRGSFGLPEGSIAGPAQLCLEEDSGFAPYLRQATASRSPITVPLNDGSPAAELVQGVQWRGFSDPCRAAVVCPLQPTSSEVLGFLILGLNPRRPYDNDYQDFVLVTSRILSTSLRSILLHEEDIGRRERAIANAEAMKLELQRQLLESQKATERHSFRFKRFIERADVGVFIIGMDGVYKYRNEAWYNILKPANPDIVLGDAWTALIDDEYAVFGQRKFEALAETKQHQSFELRLKGTWNAPSQNFSDVAEEQPMWVLTSISPELDENGEVSEILGTITDISQQKWGEKLQATHASRAHESKRQLENFIDTTSHEMRNPLSAIIQCADSIIALHEGFEKSAEHAIDHKLLESTVDAAETIVQCSKHMKTIVDGKLKSRCHRAECDAHVFRCTHNVKT